MYVKHTFAHLPGFAASEGKRLFIDEQLANTLEYPFAADSDHTIQFEGETLIEIFNANGRRYNGVTAFATEYGLLFSGNDTPEDELQQVEPEPAEPPLEFDTPYSFVSMEDLRLKVRQFATQMQGSAFRTLFTGRIKVGKHRPEGKSKAWLPEPVAAFGYEVTSVKNKWIFLKYDGADYYAKQVEASTFTFVSE